MMRTVLALAVISINNALGKRHNKVSVVQGDYADIKDFGYAAYLGIQCSRKDDDTPSYFSCGSSILNQAFLLTAAHCLVDCKKSSFISINVGSVNKRNGIQRSNSKFVVHAKYGFPAMENDIALIKMNKNVQFAQNVYRIALLKNPPREKVALVAGWGLTNEVEETREKDMKYTKQRLWNRGDCQAMINDIPKAAFCAGERKAKSYPSFGDSGGALVINKSIQIGIVSYKIVAVSRSLAVYTNVSLYFNWIETITRELNCLK